MGNLDWKQWNEDPATEYADLDFDVDADLDDDYIDYWATYLGYDDEGPLFRPMCHEQEVRK